jgi:pimeloyl-ACP methyl ester carboxylesterase
MVQIRKIEALSERVVQHYAWGHAVWHVWGPHSSSKAELSQQVGDAHHPLVLLHGGSGSWTHWIRNVTHLAKYRPVWALDMPGFGDSSLPADVSDANGLVPYLAEILQATFAGRAVDIMAFSFGGLSAGLLAAKHPARVRSLILVGVPGLGLFSQKLALRGMTPSMDVAAQREVHRHNLQAMMLAHADSVTDELIDMQQANVERDRMRRRRIARTDILAQVQGQWTCPVHGVWGEHDALYDGTLSKVPQVLTRLSSFHVVHNAGHWVMFEQADAFHQIVDPLLAMSNTNH